ncbi:MAG TPA: helix-turn-helix domain-containing protein [Methylocella sp.]|nr:helix-turn-helix domain-containing protein [Methylocella sp.]
MAQPKVRLFVAAVDQNVRSPRQVAFIKFIGTHKEYDAIDALTVSMRSQKELAELLGSRPRASDLLSGRRKISIEVAHKISEAWHIPIQLLVAPYSGKESRPSPRANRASAASPTGISAPRRSPTLRTRSAVAKKTSTKKPEEAGPAAMKKAALKKTTVKKLLKAAVPKKKVSRIRNPGKSGLR